MANRNQELVLDQCDQAEAYFFFFFQQKCFLYRAGSTLNQILLRSICDLTITIELVEPMIS